MYRVDGEEKVPMREINWPFGDNGGQGWELEIGALIARPAKDTTDSLEAKFQDFQVKWDFAWFASALTGFFLGFGYNLRNG